MHIRCNIVDRILQKKNILEAADIYCKPKDQSKSPEKLRLVQKDALEPETEKLSINSLPTFTNIWYKVW